jgi:hypothetical protein
LLKHDEARGTVRSGRQIRAGWRMLIELGIEVGLRPGER